MPPKAIAKKVRSGPRLRRICLHQRDFDKVGRGEREERTASGNHVGIRARSADVASIRHDAAICCSRRVPPPAGSHFVSPDGLLFAPLPYGLPRVKAVAYIYETRRQRAGSDAGYLHFRLADRFAI